MTVDKSKALVYVSLGSGELYHDWQVLEKLFEEDYTVESVHVVDLMYERPAGAARLSPATHASVKALATWLAACQVPLFAYRQQSELLSCRSSGFSGAHILMQCDLDCAGLYLEPTMRPGAVHFHLSQGEGKWFEAWQKPLNRDSSDESSEDEMEIGHAKMEGLRLLERRHGVLGTAPSEKVRYKSLEEMQHDRDAAYEQVSPELPDTAFQAAETAFWEIFEEETAKEEGGQ